MKLSTCDRLAAVLNEHHLFDMAKKAKEGYYDDFRSPLATPIAQLVVDLFDVKAVDLAERAMAGEWDGTREEAERWWKAQRPGTWSL